MPGDNEEGPEPPPLDDSGGGGGGAAVEPTLVTDMALLPRWEVFMCSVTQNVNIKLYYSNVFLANANTLIQGGTRCNKIKLHELTLFLNCI